MKRQRGVTFLGMMIIAGLIIFLAIIGLKLIPAYIEYATVVKHLRDLARSPESNSGSVRDLQTAFNKRAQVDDIRSVSGDDLEVIKEGNSVLITLTYSTKIKLFGNVSACVDFEASSAE